MSEAEARVDVDVIEVMMREHSQGDLDSLSSIQNVRTKNYIEDTRVHTYPSNPFQ